MKLKFTFTIILSKLLADELDNSFSPMDGLVALDQIHRELPVLHRPRGIRLCQRWFGSKTYRGCYAWYPLGFTYEQIGDELHVRNIWEFDPKKLPLRRFDVVLGEDEKV